MRRLDSLPVESKGPQRRGTDSSTLPFPLYQEALMIVSPSLKNSTGTPLTHRVNRRGRHLTPTGIEGCSRPRKRRSWGGSTSSPWKARAYSAEERNLLHHHLLNTGRNPISVIDIKKRLIPKDQPAPIYTYTCVVSLLISSSYASCASMSDPVIPALSPRPGETI